MKGKKVTIIETKNLNIGNHQYLINTPELSSGIYFIRFDIGRNVYSKKILLVK
ncbi:MAG: T9SS type A sorting domain-containing protein [Ignavibacteria bacterium]|nr:T9SS type A sorting domain-containing protein [Ignavibacteria bacterium]